MSHDQVELELPYDRVTVDHYYLDRYASGSRCRFDVQFLYRVRDPELRNTLPDWESETEAYHYYNQLPASLAAFTRELRAQRFDLIISPPSRRDDTSPYRAAIKETSAYDALDLTRYMVRVSDTLAASVKKPTDFIESLALAWPDSLNERRHALIVDDIWVRGVTAASVIFWLRERGLPKSATITVVTAVKVVE